MNEVRWAIGADLGGTKVRLADVTSEGHIQKTLCMDTLAYRGADQVINDIINHCNELIHTSKTRPVGVGVGVAGQVEKTTGVVTYAPNLQWDKVPLKERIQTALKLPVFITNDVRAATWGEWLYGAGKGCTDLVCLFIGTGVGSGIVSGGHLLQGFNNAAGELGHSTIDKNGPLCRCGNIGCVEVYAGGWAIADRVKKEMHENPLKSVRLMERAGGNVSNISTKDIIQLVLEGDHYCGLILQDAIEALTSACVNIANGLNPQKIIFGGGIAQGYPDLIPLIASGVRKRALKAVLKDLEFLPAALSEDAPLIGAAAEVFTSLSNK